MPPRITACSAGEASSAPLIAVAHSMLVIAYHMLLDHKPYQELGGNYFDERKREAVANRRLKRLEGMGYVAHLEPLPGAARADRGTTSTAHTTIDHQPIINAA